MKQTTAPKSSTPSPQPRDKATTAVGNQRSMLFIGMTLDMSWRLAIVVLAPLVIGNKIDIALKTTPLFTVTGMLMALAGTAFVIRATVKKADKAIAAANRKEAHD